MPDRIRKAWHSTLGEPSDGDHIIQLYEDTESLVSAINLYSIQAIKKGEGLILVMTKPHWVAVEQRLNATIPVDSLLRRGRFTVLDAETLLSKFMVNGAPDERLFKKYVDEALETAMLQGPRRRVRAFGEMVDLLWRSDVQSTEALEHMWTRLIADRHITLLCSYCVAHGELEADGKSVLPSFPQSLCAAHSRTLPRLAA